MNQIVDMAVSKVISVYNSGNAFDPHGTREHGSILWRNSKTHEVLPLDIVHGEMKSIALYSTDVNALVLEQDPERLYVGDWHTHAPDGDIVEQFPSPEDLQNVSVLQDFWPTRLEEKHLSPQIAPTLQLIQSCLFGDVFALRPTCNRVAYASADEQQKSLPQMVADYAAWFELQRSEWGSLGEIITRGSWREIMEEGIQAINSVLAGRAVIASHENRANSSQSIDTGFGISL